MRKVLILLVLSFVVACSGKHTDIETGFNQILADLNAANISVNNNHRKKLFSYNLPQNIGVKESNSISSRLSFYQQDIFMSLDVSAILNDKLKEINVEDLVFDQEFQLKTRTEEKTGHVYIEELSTQENLIYLRINNVFFLAMVHKVDTLDVIEQILSISQTIEVKNKLVISEFSNKETFAYEKEVIELFSDSIPDEGMIKDIIIEEEDDE
ncbi:MAG: hypothetical protein GX074_04050 [Erysipelothrix sp.]|nr:hypothetical protein [Erysipelothrix sp.]